MTSLPLPVRLAAGLVATAVEQAMDLPKTLAELPVTAVSQALQTSMRLQQKVTELAIKGDQALGALRPAEENPSWATFDDDEPPTAPGAATPAPWTRGLGAEPPVTTDVVPGMPSTDTDTATADGADGARRVETPADVAARTTATAAAGGPEPVAADPWSASASSATGPNVLPGYATLTIPQLRGKLRHLGVEDLRALLDWETGHDNRPPYLTMLGNRIATLSEQ